MAATVRSRAPNTGGGLSFGGSCRPRAVARASYAVFEGLGLDDVFSVATNGNTNGNGAQSVLHDSLGSTTGTEGPNGQIYGTLQYGPFGKTSVASGSPGQGPFLYTGRERDPTSGGLYYMRNRYYSPTLQRFLSPDPLGFRGGDTNLYAYVGNDPINAIDPMGLSAGSIGADVAAYMSQSASNPCDGPCTPTGPFVAQASDVQGGGQAGFFPKFIHPENGYSDLNTTYLFPVAGPFGVGPTFGVQTDRNGSHPYAGVAFGYPAGPSASAMLGDGPVVPGLAISGQAGGPLVGASGGYSLNGGFFTEYGYLGPALGAQISVYYVQQ